MLNPGRKFYYKHRIYTIAVSSELNYLNPPVIIFTTKETMETFIFLRDEFFDKVELLPKFRKGDKVWVANQSGTIIKTPKFDLFPGSVAYTIFLDKQKLRYLFDETHIKLIGRDLRYGRPYYARNGLRDSEKRIQDFHGKL